MSIATRRLTPERMDDPALPSEQHHAALRGLERINAVSGSAAAVWSAIERWARAHRRTTLRVLDVATGGGDVPLGLARRAAGAGVTLDLHGCDLSETALRYAGDAAQRAGVALRLYRWDALQDPPPGEFDVVTSCLFLHHLADDAALQVLTRLRDMTRGLLVISDLRRSRLGLLAAQIGTRLLSRSPIVHFDGPHSVRAAFTLSEARLLAQRAGLGGAMIVPTWPWRWLLTWTRP